MYIMAMVSLVNRVSLSQRTCLNQRLEHLAGQKRTICKLKAGFAAKSQRLIRPPTEKEKLADSKDSQKLLLKTVAAQNNIKHFKAEVVSVVWKSRVV